MFIADNADSHSGSADSDPTVILLALHPSGYQLGRILIEDWCIRIYIRDLIAAFDQIFLNGILEVESHLVSSHDHFHLSPPYGSIQYFDPVFFVICIIWLRRFFIGDQCVGIIQAAQA